MFALHGIVWASMALLLLFTPINKFGLVWPCASLCGLVWPCVALFGLVWPCIASLLPLYDLFMASLWPLYGLFMVSLWPYMVFYGKISSFLAVIDPNSFSLVLLYT